MRKRMHQVQRNVFKTCPQSGRIVGLNYKHPLAKFFFPIAGLAALVWILIRVIPKPQRAAYPCMKVAAPIASTFVAYLLGVASSVLLFRKAKLLRRQSRLAFAALLVVFGTSVALFTYLQPQGRIIADTHDFHDPLGPNQPIGEAKGIFPGRVIWVYDPEATNENCRPASRDDGYFLDKNCDQDVVNKMVSDGILLLSGKTTLEESWNAIFKYFNASHAKGEVGYSAGEKIFIKINSVHAGGGSMNSDYSIRYNSDYGNVDTSPHAVHALLRQLVYFAGVPQENIYVGDPFRDIFKHSYDKWHTEFPNINYMSNSQQTGRLRFVKSSEKVMAYSDKGSVLTVQDEAYYKIVRDADYLINIPAMKGHRWGGVSFFAKNHFGSITRSSAEHLHPGLHRVNYDQPLREGYRQYRVFVDIMGHPELGGKTLLYLMDGLWGTSYEHDPPVKFQSPPFNNDWSSSIFVSLDPVAIASVCLDVLQAEFTEEDLSTNPPRYTYVRFGGVDDYLHQAADAAWWPDGNVYDPDNDGAPIGSLGVHEHWNNPIDRQYSRNLGTGGGIELLTWFNITSVNETKVTAPENFVLHQNYPNPFNPSTHIVFELRKPAKVTLSVFNLKGERLATLLDSYRQAGVHSAIWDGRLADGATAASSGVYFYSISINDGAGVSEETRRMALIK